MVYGTRKFNTTHKVSPVIPILSRISLIHRIDSYFLKSILILSSHLRLDLSKGLFPVGLSVNIVKELLPSSILATSPAHLNLAGLLYMFMNHEEFNMKTVWTYSNFLMLDLDRPWILTFLKLIFRDTDLPFSCISSWFSSRGSRCFTPRSGIPGI